MYRMDSLLYLKDDLAFFTKRNKILGNKMVRGAYWNKENQKNNLLKKKQILI